MLVVLLRKHLLVIREWPFDQLRRERGVADRESCVILGNTDLNGLRGSREQAQNLVQGLERYDHVAFRRRGNATRRLAGSLGETVPIRGYDPQLSVPDLEE